MSEPMPDPQVWPYCDKCGTAYVLRRNFQAKDGQIRPIWVWQRDCKHRAAEPKLYVKAPESAEVKAG